MFIIEFVVAIIIARLVWKAFQGWCYTSGRSESAGALSILTFLVLAAVVLGVGLLILAAYLSPSAPIPVN